MEIFLIHTIGKTPDDRMEAALLAVLLRAGQQFLVSRRAKNSTAGFSLTGAGKSFGDTLCIADVHQLLPLALQEKTLYFY